jgi:hypothetical protein
MARWIFPEDRTAYVYTGALNPLLEASTTQGIQIFLEPECQTLAVICDITRSVIVGSTIYVTPDGLLPFFYGPPEVKVLYARAIGRSQVYPLDALDAARLREMDKHQVWEGPALPANGERTPPFIWVDTTNSPDNAVYMVVDDTFSDLYTDIYVDLYGGGIGWVGP